MEYNRTELSEFLDRQFRIVKEAISPSDKYKKVKEKNLDKFRAKIEKLFEKYMEQSKDGTTPQSRRTLKKLLNLIPQMFTDNETMHFRSTYDFDRAADVMLKRMKEIYTKSPDTTKGRTEFMKKIDSRGTVDPKAALESAERQTDDHTIENDGIVMDD